MIWKAWLLILLLLGGFPAMKTDYQIFLPVIADNPGKKGIGITDRNISDVPLIGAAWYYSWGNGNLFDHRFVPMDFSGREWLLPDNYSGLVLLFNEPENPAQANLTPTEAVKRYGEFHHRYPLARIIAGNVGLWGPTWILSFQLLLDQQGLARPQGWGVHGYIEPGIAAERVIQFWDWFKGAIVKPGELLWITEMADVEGRPEELGRLIAWASHNADRYAVFANRIDDNAGWYPDNWPSPNKLALVDGAGSLTTIGEYYRLIK